jgi:hypothetical protein
MTLVKCSVDGCNARLQPISKPILRDRESWVYRECDRCLRPACEKHSSVVGGEIVCDRCRREDEARRLPIPMIGLDIVPRPRAGDS